MHQKLTYVIYFILIFVSRIYGSSQPDTIYYDNGNPLRIDITQNALFGVRFTPAQSFTLTTINIMVLNEYNADNGCNLWVAQDNAGMPVWPATFVGQIPAPLPDRQWIQFELAGPMYFEGDFFIIAQQKGGPYPSDSFWMGIDYGTTTNRTKKSYNNGQFWQTETQGDALIRALGQYGTVAPTSPCPANNASLVPIDAQLNWISWPNAAAQDLYIGTDFETVLNANNSSPEYIVRLPGDTQTYAPDTFNNCTQYYWRIDTALCTDCPFIQGPVWNMKTTCDRPAPAGDINCDCRVDFKDIAIVANNWLTEVTVPCIPQDEACTPTPEELTPPPTPDGYEYIGYDVVINSQLKNTTIPLDYNESPKDISHIRSRTIVKNSATVCDLIVRHLFRKKDECGPTQEELTAPSTPDGYEYVGYNVVVNFQLTATTIPLDYIESPKDLTFVRSHTIVTDGVTVCDVIVTHVFTPKTGNGGPEPPPPI